MIPSLKTSPTILLLVSDPLVRAVFQETLENSGYCVVPAGNLGNAVDRLKTTRPDLLIIRSYVSDVPGHDAATYLRKRCPGLPVLMVGGQMEDDRLTGRTDLERFYVFPRPFTASELLDEVVRVLKRARESSAAL
jgi:DNA-binding response OmpR family regulator